MKAENSKRPAPFKIIKSEGKATIKFAVNIEAVEVDVDENTKDTVFKYDVYTSTTVDRAGLEEAVSENFADWLEKAKQNEADALSKEIRAKRDKLLQESDKHFALDRLGITFPEKITTSTLLTAVKGIVEQLTAVSSGDMARYRQALRDLPQQEGFPYNVKFPVKPNN